MPMGEWTRRFGALPAEAYDCFMVETQCGFNRIQAWFARRLLAANGRLPSDRCAADHPIAGSLPPCSRPSRTSLATDVLHGFPIFECGLYRQKICMFALLRVHGIQLTDAGKAFLDHARLALAQVEAAVEVARRAAQPGKKTFAIGFQTGHEMNWLPRAMHVLRDELKNINVTVSSDYSPDLAEGLVRGRST
jgi:hypothetical protein